MAEPSESDFEQSLLESEVPAQSPTRSTVALEECENRIGYRFNDQQLLVAALTHASGAEHRLASNERMEFLGDAILGFVVCEELYRKFPEFLEGDMTKLKSIVVSRLTCAKISKALGMRDFLILGKGMTTHPTIPTSLFSDVLESLIAAIYLDGGLVPAKEFIDNYIGPEIDLAAAGELEANYKSLLQQFAQREHSVTPTYRLLDEKGPDHSKCFKIAAQIGPSRYPAAWGRSKKEAEQRAAHNAICCLRDEPAPYPSEDDAEGE